MRAALAITLFACRGSEEPTGRDPEIPTPEPPVPTDTERPPLCAPILQDTGGGTWIEGDTVTLALSCQTGLAREGLLPAILSGPSGTELDPASWTVTFPTHLASAGPQEVVVGITRADAAPEQTRRVVYVNDAGPDVDGNLPPDADVYTHEFGLPVMFCWTTAPLTEEYAPVECALDGERYPLAQMKIRGAASASYPKTSFTLDFGEDPPLDGGPLGMKDKEHLVLVSTFDDNSYVRQKLVYDLWEDLDDFWGSERPTPDTAWVVLYLDDRYHGLYVAIDHVDDEFFDEHGFNRAGNIYKSVTHDANFYRTDAAGNPKTDLTLGWEKEEGSATDWSDLEDLTAFVADSDPATFAAQASDWMRVDDFMDWYLLVAYAASQDSAGKNAYLYDDPLTLEFRYVPWDHNHSWGQSWTTERVPVEVFDLFEWNNGIFAHFHADPVLAIQLWGRYEQAAAPGGPLDTASLLARLDAYYAEIDLAARRDWATWEDEYRSFSRWSSRTDFTDYEGEKAYLYAWVQGRRAAFDAARPRP